MRICGIDPGLGGAIAFADLSLSGVVSNAVVYDMPITPEVDGKPLPDAIAVRRLVLSEKPDCVVLEHVQHHNGKGNQWRFALGFGEIRAAVRSCFEDKRIHQVYPAKWKKALGLSSEKDPSLIAARADFPDLAISHLKRKKDEGRAEALELVIYYARCLLPLGAEGIDVC